MSPPVAHTSHWLADLLYLVPVAVAVGLLALQAVRDRRRKRAAAPDDKPPAR